MGSLEDLNLDYLTTVWYTHPIFQHYYVLSKICEYGYDLKEFLGALSRIITMTQASAFRLHYMVEDNDIKIAITLHDVNPKSIENLKLWSGYKGPKIYVGALNDTVLFEIGSQEGRDND